MAREYKDSGIEWIGQIPKEWEVKRVKYASDSINKGNGITKEEVFEDGDTPCVRYGEIYSRYNNSFNHCISATRKEIQKSPRYFNKGDILFASTGELVEEIGKNIVYLGEEPCLAGGDIIVLSHHQSPSFFNYALNCHSSQAQKSRNKAKLKVVHISASEIGDILITLPSLAIQQKIADYLDKLCGEVDEMVALQETMIEELKAYKQSVITEAVTKGLNPHVPMRDSGIDWIGEIPEHWEAKKLKYIVDYIESGTSVNAGNVPAQANEYGVLKTSAVSKYVFDATENKTVVSEEMDKVSCPVRKNTIIVSRMNTPELVGACGYVEKNYDTIFLPDRLWQVHFVDTVYVKYIWYALRGSNIRNYYSSLSVGSSSSMQNISQSQFSNGSIPIPCDVDEQRAIVSYLDTKCSEIDSLIAIKQAKIEELKEYKKSVIYEYVTGKKDVL
jgi:type I restriction enzyme S subunit